MEAQERVEKLSCWRGLVDATPLSGGLTNVNFKVQDGADSFVVRLGGDIPVHQIMRFNEHAAARAAYAAGVSPEVVHSELGVLVMRFVEGQVYGEADVRDPKNLGRVADLIKRFHTTVTEHLVGPVLVFWVFHVLRNYGHSLTEGGSVHLDKLPRLMSIAQSLERAVGKIDLVFGHNDLLPANFIDDGSRLWLIDFDYAGFNSPLFDLSNLASNNQLSDEQETWLLEHYFGAPPDQALRRSYEAMKCASLLRETMWSMISEIHSELDIDYPAYTAENLERFERTFEAVNREHKIQ